MSIPVRSLPVVQNWDCHSCSDCCRIGAVVTDEERRRIEALDLTDDQEVAPKPWFSKGPRGSGRWQLRHRPGGGCVFLTAGNHCRIQERYGADAKPFVCRLFPFILIPAGDHFRVGMRFSCPSAAANSGRPVTDAAKELKHLALMLERHVGKSADAAPPPAMPAGQQVSWPDACRIVQVLVEILENRGDRLERRLRTCLAVARVGAKTEWSNLKGARVTRYLQAVRTAMEAEAPRDAADLPPPDGLVGGVMFRTLLAVFAGRERDARRATRVRNRFGRVLAGWRFARGRGRVPRVNEFLPETTFEEIERRTGLPPEIDETLERYYVVKLNSLQFCGASNFDLPFWEGLGSLVLTLPMILWLRRAFDDKAPADAVQLAIQIVDDHFGGDPMLGFPHIQYLQRTLVQSGELEKLVAWYSR